MMTVIVVVVIVIVIMIVIVHVHCMNPFAGKQSRWNRDDG